MEPPEGAQPCPHLGSGPLASRTVREQILGVFSPSPTPSLWVWQPWESHTGRAARGLAPDGKGISSRISCPSRLWVLALGVIHAQVCTPQPVLGVGARVVVRRQRRRVRGAWWSVPLPSHSLALSLPETGACHPGDMGWQVGCGLALRDLTCPCPWPGSPGTFAVNFRRGLKQDPVLPG